MKHVKKSASKKIVAKKSTSTPRRNIIPQTFFMAVLSVFSALAVFTGNFVKDENQARKEAAIQQAITTAQLELEMEKQIAPSPSPSPSPKLKLKIQK